MKAENAARGSVIAHSPNQYILHCTESVILKERGTFSHGAISYFHSSTSCAHAVTTCVCSVSLSVSLVGTEGDFSIDKRRANSKDSLEIIKYIVIKGIVTYGRKLIIFTNF